MLIRMCTFLHNHSPVLLARPHSFDRRHGLLRLMKEDLEHVFQARTRVVLHLQKTDATLIVFDPAHDRLFDLDGPELVGKPELQSETCPARERGLALDPTTLQGEVHERAFSMAARVSIVDRSSHDDTRANSMRHRFTPFAAETTVYFTPGHAVCQRIPAKRVKARFE